MVNNGVEYGDMQLIAEVYDVLKHVLGMFAEWKKSELESYLIEITEKIFRKKDDETGEYVVDYGMDHPRSC
jgi:6-phosphogluconate dehydrogenase